MQRLWPNVLAWIIREHFIIGIESILFTLMATQITFLKIQL